MRMEIKSIQDLYKMKHWLELAASNAKDSDFMEINQTIKRLDREIAYFNNFNSKDYEDYKNKHDRPLELVGWDFSKAELEKFASNYVDTMKKRRVKANELLKKDHTKAMNWVIENDKYLDDEAVAYGRNEDYGNIKDEIMDFQDMFIQYIHCIAQDMANHVLYNDEIDEWYFQKKDTDKKFEKSDYFFPNEVFIIDYKDKHWYYSEMSGQGTSFGLCVLDKEGYEKIAKDYGLTLDELKYKTYVIEGN